MRNLWRDGGFQKNLGAGMDTVERRQSRLRHEIVQARELVTTFQVELLEEIESGPFVRRCGGGHAEAAQCSDEWSAMHCSSIQEAGGRRRKAGGRRQEAEVETA